MAENAYQDGKLNVRSTAVIPAVHTQPKPAESVQKMTGTDLRSGSGKGK